MASRDDDFVVVDRIRDKRNPDYCALVLVVNPTLQQGSLWDNVDSDDEKYVREQIENAGPDSPLGRAVGALAGLAVGDSLGHVFEFQNARNSPPSLDERGQFEPLFEYPCAEDPAGRFHAALNRFRIKRGQWTDDTSMALCLADSMLCEENGGYSGSRARIWYWNWLATE